MISILRTFTSFGALGRLPGAPGTYGSLATLPLAYIWALLVGEQHLWTLGLLVILSVFGTIASSIVERHLGTEDPSEIIIDEVVGQWIALLAVPMAWPYWLAAFVLFRVFDIWKPWLIGRVQDLHGGLGIMLDDILAGLLAFLLIQGVAAPL